GEPFPIYYKNDVPYTLDESDLPLELPEVDKYLPTETGDAPLARAKNWKTKDGHPLETDTMPGWAGSSWYYLRYMDPNNETAMVSEESVNYWKQVDLYLGGSEHATGHLLYVRFWTKFLYDIGKLPFNEPAKKLVNQGMIQGVSSLVYRINNTNKFVSNGLIDQHETTVLHIDVSMVSNDELDLDAFKNWRPEFKDAEFVLEDGKYICGSEVEKMSKRWHNVVNPDDVVDRYGADTLRMYEMFLGPIELSKPWSTNGIDGVYKFLKKYWRLFIVNEKFSVSDKEPNGKELKSLHKTIKKIEEDIERLSFNTCISAFMICVNELSDLKCNKRAILEPLTIVLASFAPHITEEVWQHLGHQTSVTQATYPKFDESKLVEDNFSYPVSVNGKTRFKIELPLNLDKNQVEKEVLDSEQIQKWLEGNNPKKVIVVPGRIVNVVV
ncbi:MAG: class I tRNA ligase family protein, partial [Bacteroidia bacterium]|nr:class I tRNA ligase family protein [Bacteroidia bacterium]